MSTIKLYSSTNVANTSWKLIASKLFKIDSIAEYLAQFTATTIEDAQRIKNGLEISIKLDLSQTYSEPTEVNGIKYISIQNSPTERVNYYFVKRPKWKSTKCVEFELIMDTLNTFNDGSDYVFKANTRIIREHKDRFLVQVEKRITIDYYINSEVGSISEGDRVQLIDDNSHVILEGIVNSIDAYGINIIYDNQYEEATITQEINASVDYPFEIAKDNANYMNVSISENAFSFQYTNKYYRKIDPVNENINPMLQCGDANGQKLDNPKSLLAQNWYLLYRNQNDPSESLVNPVECFLIPENQTNTTSGYITGGRLVPSYLEDGKYYYFKVTSGQVTLSNGVTLTYGATGRQVLMITKARDVLSVTYFYCGNSYGSDEVVVENYDGILYVTFDNLPVKYRVENDFLNTGNYDYYALQDNMPYDFDNSGEESYIDGVDKVDRTDAKNIKLIKLPYCPYNFTITGSKLDTNGNQDWDYAEVTQSGGGILYALKLKKMSTKLYSEIVWSGSSNHPFNNLYVGDINPSVSQLRQDMLDSKMFHNEFFKPTYYYDSFSYQINLEKCNITSFIENNEYAYLKIRYDVTSTINSRFMFTFTNYYIKYGEQNYAKNLIIVRNNEEVLYNVAFINYVRTGYNFDQKAKALTNVANWTGVGLSSLSIGASLLAPSIPLKVAGIVASAVSIATSVKSAVVSSVQSEQTIQNKLVQTQNQTSSVAGSDDVDLMSVYAENRLKYLIYEPMPNMKNLINDMFFYAGYNSGRMGVPNHNTRCNFDYLECDAVLESAGANIPQEIIDEIKNAYKVGVTFIHKTTRTSNKWDIEQKYENWENSLL